MVAQKMALTEAFVLLCLFTCVSGMGKDRVYYIAAVEVMWDYAPSGHNLVDGRKDAARMFIKNGKDRIGSRYKKCLYKQYTDDSYMDEIEQPGWLGLVGPVLRAEKGDRFVIHFKNRCKRQFSMHPHGVHYLKGHEGALYIDGTWGKLKQDDMVPPNGSYTYIWSIPENFAPLDSDPNCMTWAYHSHINPARDTNSGLIGALLTCKKGILNDDNTRKDIKYDFVMLYKIYDESLSWYIDENLEKCKDPKLCKQLLSSNDPGFATSNMMHGINGRLFGNLPAFEACENEHVVWNMIGMGTEIDLHTAHINGQTFTVNDHRIDTVHLFAADFMTGDMYPKNPGRWLIQCAVNDHYTDGMQAFLEVKSCSQERAYAPPTWTAAHKTRTYYITAEEVWWRYAPSVWNKFSGGSLSDPSSRSATYFGKSMTRIGGQYKKALFFEYTDETFTRRKYRSDSEIHLGFLGPVIRAEVGESIRVVFKNYASRNYSMHPHGAMYDKANEGQPYNDSSKATKDNAVPPGGMYTYTWYVPESYGPTYSDPDCLTNFYQSAVDPVRDTSSGLVGPLLTCKKGTIDHEGKQKGADKEFILVVQVTNENLSWYLDENIKKRIKDMSKVNKSDPAFIESNRMRNINGRSYGNLEGLEMCVGDKVSWHLIGLGTQTDIHPVHFFGNTLSKINRVDVFAVFPSTTQTLAMVPDNPGIWGLISRTNEHFKNGLTALYTVHGCGMKPPTKVPYDAKSRRYYVGAVEVEWEYAPLKRDVVKGKSLKRPDSVGYIFVRHDKGFIGSKYYKAVYREFTDASFTEPKKRNERNIHRGILGPAIRAEVGEVIEVVFKNMASRPYSIHPHGVFYSKNNEGAPYLDHTGKHTDDMVTKNGFYVYRWLVPDRAGPGKSDPNCISWPYYSSVNPVKDVYAGLVGNIIICRKGILSKDGKRKDHIDREITLFFFLFDEMMSWYINKTTSKYAPSRMHDMSNSTFMASNIMNSINGFIYGNNQGLVMYKGEKIAWYIFALGGTMDMHTVHFHGQVLIHKRGSPTIVDVLAIFPGTTETLEMGATNPGTWLLHCHVNDHLTNGMETFYTIKDSSAGGAWTTRRTTMDWRGTDSHSRDDSKTREIDYDSRGMDSESMEEGGDDIWGKMDMIILIVACVVAAVVLGAAIIIPARSPPRAASRTVTTLEGGNHGSETITEPKVIENEEFH